MVDVEVGSVSYECTSLSFLWMGEACISNRRTFVSLEASGFRRGIVQPTKKRMLSNIPLNSLEAPGFQR